jgi:zinc-ribbon domain
VRCPRCGNENPETMRFCGMCGGTLLSVAPAAKPERGASPAAQPSATATATRPAVPEHPRPPADSSPSISGPSFLGLNDAPPARKRSNLSIDPQHPGARNLNYLLDDEEEHRGGGGAGKFFLIVLALLLAVGFGYLRWKNQLPWLNAGANKPTPAAQTSDQPPIDSATPTTPSITPEAQPAANPASNPPSANTSSGTQPGNAPASTPAAAAPAQPTTDSSTPKADSGSPPENATTGKEQPDAAPAAKPAEPAAKSDDSSDENESAAAPPAAAPRGKATPAPTKPKAASKPVDSVAEAQRYLYGRGAAQDCDHGLRILKPLANGGNSKAMVEMGALYSAGLCAPHDLPTAYRWFAVALRKDPSNEAIQNDLQKLWGEMTQPERQLAIKLTQ